MLTYIKVAEKTNVHYEIREGFSLRPYTVQKHNHKAQALKALQKLRELYPNSRFKLVECFD